MSKPKLAISFSGGATSAFMTHFLLSKYGDTHEIVTVFSNTGLENEATLRFVRDCDKYMGFNTVWLEAVIKPQSGAGVSFNIVDFQTAARKGEPFEAMIQKYGIPNVNFPHCSRVLKKQTIRAYFRRLGWKVKDYRMAIGIRADEWDRRSKDEFKENLYYPLIDEYPTQKADINRFWSQQPFRLQLKSYEGNCETCWKKSDRKLCTIANESPSRFVFFRLMEERYANYRPETQPNRPLPSYFFRLNRTVNDIFRLSCEPFNAATDESLIYDPEPGEALSCRESCEAF